MFKKKLVLKSVFISIAALFIISFHVSKLSFGFPGGTPYFITDAAPFCANCHSATSKQMLRNVPEAERENQFYEIKHYSMIEKGQNEYENMDLEKRKALLADVKKVDANASVKIIAPFEVKPDVEITVTVIVRGGAGPVIGIMLLDNDLWWQSRSIAADGWEIVNEPVIVDPYGKFQDTFMSKRTEGLKRNINYVNIYGINTDIDKDVWQESKVVYTLRTPGKQGDYQISAAFLFGTEKASKFGYEQTVRGKLPKGGTNGASGRVMFSNVVKIKVH